MPVNGTDLSHRLAVNLAPCSPSRALAKQLADLAALELEHSDRVVERYGQRAYEVVRECRRVAALASRTSSKLSNRDGTRRPRRSDS